MLLEARAPTMTLTVEIDREEDGRWIAEVVELPGVMVYGSTRAEAINGAQALALRVIADRVEHREAVVSGESLSFVEVAA
jgi:predicted RNase H-like HicB family nuclease